MMKTKKPYADDWIFVNNETEYSKNLKLYWYNNKIYNELSAQHNGIIDLGYKLKKQLRSNHNENRIFKR